MIKTRLFHQGRINYSIDYRQFQMAVTDEITGETEDQLMHQEVVKYFEFPWHFGTTTQFGPCLDVGEYYRS
jgi:hypothetical protein